MDYDKQALDFLKVHRTGNIGKHCSIIKDGYVYGVQMFTDGVYEYTSYHKLKREVLQYAKEMGYRVVYDFTKCNN